MHPMTAVDTPLELPANAGSEPIAALADSSATLARQFIRYVLVGGAGFIVDFSVLVLLTESAGLHYLASAALAFLSGLSVVYMLSVRWVFHRRRFAGNASVEFQIFALVGIVGLVFNHALLWAFTDIIGLYYPFSKLIAAGAILVWNFGARKLLLFR
jgi:putative flippase GtrA